MCASIDLLLPPVCASCFVDLDASDEPAALCGACRQLLLAERIEGACPNCGTRSGSNSQTMRSCPHCQGRSQPFRQVIPLGRYEGSLRQAIVRMKHFHEAPLTGGFGESDAGGFWNAELKHAGFDEIIFTGRAAEPVWLWVNEGEAELMEGSSLWGLEIGECQDRMREMTGEAQAKTALIGPAGERLVRLGKRRFFKIVGKPQG